jgi:predicted site-specific integrase-resolvase
MNLVETGEISTLVIAHKDRLVRFGFEWFQYFGEKHGTQIIIMNQEKLSPEQEDYLRVLFFLILILFS